MATVAKTMRTRQTTRRINRGTFTTTRKWPTAPSHQNNSPTSTCTVVCNLTTWEGNRGQTHCDYGDAYCTEQTRRPDSVCGCVCVCVFVLYSTMQTRACMNIQCKRRDLIFADCNRVKFVKVFKTSLDIEQSLAPSYVTIRLLTLYFPFIRLSIN